MAFGAASLLMLASFAWPAPTFVACDGPFIPPNNSTWEQHRGIRYVPKERAGDPEQRIRWCLANARPYAGLAWTDRLHPGEVSAHPYTWDSSCVARAADVGQPYYTDLSACGGKADDAEVRCEDLVYNPDGSGWAVYRKVDFAAIDREASRRWDTRAAWCRARGRPYASLIRDPEGRFFWDGFCAADLRAIVEDRYIDLRGCRGVMQNPATREMQAKAAREGAFCFATDPSQDPFAHGAVAVWTPEGPARKGNQTWAEYDGDREDRCFDSIRLLQRTCDGAKSRMKEVRCENGCSAGACLREPQDCFESNPKRDPSVRGYATIDGGITKYYGYCCEEAPGGCVHPPNTLLRPVCDGGRLQTGEFECPGSCQGGRCVKKPSPVRVVRAGFPSAWEEDLPAGIGPREGGERRDPEGPAASDGSICVDSDGGENPETPGEARLVGAGTIHFLFDRCASPWTVEEAVCRWGRPAYVTIRCGAGRACTDGVCGAARLAPAGDSPAGPASDLKVLP